MNKNIILNQGFYDDAPTVISELLPEEGALFRGVSRTRLAEVSREEKRRFLYYRILASHYLLRDERKIWEIALSCNRAAERIIKLRLIKSSSTYYAQNKIHSIGKVLEILYNGFIQINNRGRTQLSISRKLSPSFKYTLEMWMKCRNFRVASEETGIPKTTIAYRIYKIIKELDKSKVKDIQRFSQMLKELKTVIYHSRRRNVSVKKSPYSCR